MKLRSGLIINTVKVVETNVKGNDINQNEVLEIIATVKKYLHSMENTQNKLDKIKVASDLFRFLFKNYKMINSNSFPNSIKFLKVVIDKLYEFRNVFYRDLLSLSSTTDLYTYLILLEDICRLEGRCYGSKTLRKFM